MVNRVVFGRRNDGTYGFDVSIQDVDVLTAGDVDLIFSSKWSHSALLHQTGFLVKGATATFPTLSYIPIVFAYIVESNKVVAPKVSSQYYGGPPPYKEIPWTRRICVEPIFTVTTSSVTMKTPPSFVSTATYTARYAVFRVPGF